MATFDGKNEECALVLVLFDAIFTACTGPKLAQVLLTRAGSHSKSPQVHILEHLPHL